MSKPGDILDQLWIQAINLHPQGQWIEACLILTHKAGGSFSGTGDLLRRL
jgi:hypothetical protein